MHPENIEAGKLFGTWHGFNICTCVPYLGGYIRDSNSKRDWMIEHKETWEKNSCTILKTVGKYPQASNAAVVCAIQL